MLESPFEQADEKNRMQTKNIWRIKSRGEAALFRLRLIGKNPVRMS